MYPFLDKCIDWKANGGCLSDDHCADGLVCGSDNCIIGGNTGNCCISPIIVAPVLSNKGTWGDWESCAPGHHVIGMWLRIEGKQGSGDDTALNAIRLKCSDDKILISKEGTWGDWKPWSGTSSEEGIECLWLGYEEPCHDCDRTGANGVRFRASNKAIYKPGDGPWSEVWGEAACPDGTVVTGFRTKVSFIRFKSFNQLSFNFSFTGARSSRSRR